MKTGNEIFDKAMRFANNRHIKPDKNDYEDINRYEQDYGGWDFVHDEALECYQEGYTDGQEQSPIEFAEWVVRKGCQIVNDNATITYWSIPDDAGNYTTKQLFEQFKFELTQ